MKKIVCLGGPADGELVPDRGPDWDVIVRVDEPPGSPEPISSDRDYSGRYVKHDGRYHWEPDAMSFQAPLAMRLFLPSGGGS